jgi:dihydropyrimidinase
MFDYDLVIKGGTIATAAEVFRADIGIAGGKVAAIAAGLDAGASGVDATGRIVTPGGVDSHCHIEQLSSSGLRNADTFKTATRAAAFGGTTTVIPFVAQQRGMSLAEEAEAYHALARRGAIVDYALHLIIADPTRETLERDLPALVAAGHGSIKLFMTYDRLKLDDEAILDVLFKARELGALVMAHAENHGMIPG